MDFQGVLSAVLWMMTRWGRTHGLSVVAEIPWIFQSKRSTKEDFRKLSKSGKKLILDRFERQNGAMALPSPTLSRSPKIFPLSLSVE